MIHIRVVERGPVPKAMRKEIDKVLRAAWFATGSLWHSEMSARHFTREGARAYGYSPRSGESGNPSDKGFRRSYTGRKLRTRGHTLPLVWTGLSRSLARIRDVRATPKGCRVILPVGFNRRNPHSKVNMRDEVTKVLPDEERRLAAFFEKVVDRNLNAAEDRAVREVLYG